MDLTKLLALLEDKALHFARADRFEDPYEGEWTGATAERFRKLGNKKAVDIPRKLQQSHFISCWCASEHESAALWKLYLQSPEGVAVRSDLASLSAVLERAPQKITVAEVTYLDYDSKIQIPWTQSFLPLFTRKRRSFSHEQEVRAIIHPSRSNERGALAIAVPISVPTLIKKIYVSPSAPLWFGSLVERVVRRYELEVPIESSQLYCRPVR
jgi:hypothetical protein